MSGRLWLLWFVLAVSALSLGTRSPDVPTPRAFYVAADTDTTARKRLLIEHADSLSGMLVDGEAVQLLFGHVRGRQDSTLLFAHRAVGYRDRREYLLIGSVLIVDQGDSLRADSVVYNERTKVGRAQGRVRLSDGEVVLRAPSGIYFVDEKRARFEEGLTIVDSTAELMSGTGIYWTEEKRAELADSVRLTGENTYLEADSLTYFRETEVSIARSDVFIERFGGDDGAEADSTIRTLLFSDRAYNDDRAQLSRIEGHPLLVQLRHDSTGAEVDTFIIEATRLEAVEQESITRLVAVDSVRIWQQDFAAVADSVVYERITPPADTTAADTVTTDTTASVRREETRLYRGPMAWVGEAQVSGDTLWVKGRGGDVDSLFVRNRAFVAQRDSVLGRINQVRGRHLIGVFLEDSTRVFTVAPNAEVIQHRRSEAGDPEGSVQASVDRLVIYLRGDELQRVEGLCTDQREDCIQGTIFPEGQQPEPFRLNGFVWTPERRPIRSELLDRDRVLRRLERRAPPLPEGVPFQVVPPPTEPETTENRGPEHDRGRPTYDH